MPVLVWQNRRPARPPVLWPVLGFLVLAQVTLTTITARAQSSVGIYSDVTGDDCTLADQSPGFINAYVVVRPGPGGTTGVRFSAPKPSCLTATYVGDVLPGGTLTIGNSQLDVTVAFLGCKNEPVHALTIQYFGAGTTPTCCAYPVIPAGNRPNVIVVDCNFFEHASPGLTSYVNPDATCECTGNSPPDMPGQPSPASGAANVSVFTALSWVASDDDGNLAEFDVYLGTSSPPPLVATVTEPVYAPGQFTPLATHYWRVVARDDVGAETSGPLWTFTTRAVNSPPSAPSAPIPTDSALAVPLGVTLQWQCADIDGDTLAYDVYFGSVSPPPLLASDVAATAYALPMLALNTHYYWRIVARDPSGHETPGAVWAFETEFANYAPQPPHNPQPPDGALHVPGDVVLTWQASDADGDALTYDLYFGTEFSPPLLASGMESAGYQLSGLLEGTRYYWRVIAHDDSEQTSGPVWTFATHGANTPPGVPSSPQPAMDANGVPVKPVLAWQCVDPDGDPLTFDVYLGDVFPPRLVATDHPATSFPVGMLAFSQRYYWRIVARDGSGAESSGPVWEFVSAANSPPNSPSSPLPGNGGFALVSTILSWSASDPDGQRLTFDVYLGTSTNPPLVASSLMNKFYDPGTLQQATAYYWRVVASDGELTSSSPTWMFATHAAGVLCPGQIGVYSDAGGNRCDLTDQGPGPIDVYVVLTAVYGATGVQFAAPKPACFTGVYLGEDVPSGLLSIGTSQTGMAVALAGCLVETTPLVTIRYLGFGTTPACCEYPLQADPVVDDVLVVDCNFAEIPCRGESLVINQDESCWCDIITPVFVSNFSARETDEGVEVSWELSGDETAERFSVLRRTGAHEDLSVVGEGAVTGTSGSWVDASVEPATTYHYELLVRTPEGNEFRSPVATITTRAMEFALGQNHPNPFNPTTVIPYTLPNGAATVRVRLLVLDVSGRVVRTLVDEDQAGGSREAVWDGKDDRGGPVSSGVYFSLLEADGQRRTRKLVLLK